MANGLKQNSIRGNIVFALSIFIVFLLIFESQLVIPVWLQPVGRMHPALVHFPIVIVMLAMIMESLRSRRNSDDSAEFYRTFTRELLFAGVVVSGVTVITGIFLTREEGYDSETLLWHKWSGVAVFLLSALIYSAMESRWLSVSLARAGAVLTVVAVVVAGHQGGALTHGENFIVQPLAALSEKEVVSLEDALAFEHAIKPIFESKCRSCHNSQKRKGELLLSNSDSVTIAKGGESGALFVSGDPKESLLFKRITLPIEEKEHMPPSDQPQLTAAEKDLIYYWIKAGAQFSAQIIGMPETDSFRLVATRFIEDRMEAEEQYDFSAVEPETLTKLNSNYRVIRPVSKNSPALTVNIYNQARYSPTALEELKDVKEQVVALDLSKMPVRDEDIKHVARLENLQKLNLNFTAVTGSGLSHLRTLTDLRHLSLAGTAVSYADVEKILSQHPKLELLAVWETSINPDEIALLQKTFPAVRVFGAPEEGMALIKLNAPRINNKSRVFRDTIALELFHPVPGADIRFTTDGSEPDSMLSTLFKGPTTIRETTTIKATAYKDGWLSSDAATLHVYRSSQMPDTAILLSKLNRVHVQKGAQTFFDYELGSFNANSPAWANNWGGVRNNDLVLLLRYDDPARISTIHLNCLIETENGIFPPESIEVWGGKDPDNLKLVGRKRIVQPTVYRKPYIELFECAVDAEVSHLKIIASPVMKLPAWHKSKDKPAFLLVDEILIN